LLAEKTHPQCDFAIAARFRKRINPFVNWIVFF
jgi:hypothetical protein